MLTWWRWTQLGKEKDLLGFEKTRENAMSGGGRRASGQNRWKGGLKRAIRIGFNGFIALLLARKFGRRRDVIR